MTLTYAQALERALAAAESGEAVDDLIKQTPEFAQRLQEDLGVAAAVSRFSTALPVPSAATRQDASARLMARLATLPLPVEEKKPSILERLGLGRVLAAPRWAMASVVVLALAVAGLGLFALGSDSSVEAGTIEGVVVEKQGDSITIQTGDSLQQVAVPASALDIDAIQLGEVVAIKVRRDRGSLVARAVERIAGNVDSWCDVAEERCRPVRDRLDDAQERCEAGDAIVCRRLAGVCERAPILCRGDRPTPTPDSRPAHAATPLPSATVDGRSTPQRVVSPTVTLELEATPARPVSTTPARETAQPSATRGLDATPVRPSATATREREASPTATRPRPSSTQTTRPTERPGTQR